MNIKVTVDYGRGYYYVTGLKQTNNGGEFSEIRKIISGIEDDGKIKYSYTDRKLIENRKKEMKVAIRKIMKKNPGFKISRKALKKVDLLMFKALKAWDEQINNNSDYATKYLMASMQEFDKKDRFGRSRKVSEKICRKARADALKKAGIDITYNVGILGADDNLSFLDRIIGIRIAKIQQKLLGIKVINKAIVKKAKTVYDDKSIYESNLDTIENPKDELLEFDGEEDIVKNIAMNIEKDKEAGLFDSQEIEQDEEDELLEFDGEEDIVKNIAMNIEKDKEVGLFDSQELEQKIIPIRREKRKIENRKQYIKNKRFNSAGMTLKERAARLAIGALATGGVAFAAYNATKIGEVFGRNNDSKVSYEKEYASNIDDIETQVRFNSRTLDTTNVQTKIKVGQDIETDVKKEVKQKVKTEKEKIEEFRKQAIQKYMDTFIIGKRPAIGDMLEGKTYYENPDGTGNKGYFNNNLNYKVEHITIITPEKWYTVSTDGKSLPEILSEYPNYTTYTLHFTNLKTGGGLGFVTQDKLEEMITSKVNSIIENKKAISAKSSAIQNDNQR